MSIAKKVLAGYEVILTEHERGWGSKDFHREYFKPDDLSGALEYSKKINSENTETSAPDYYIVASNPKEIFNTIF